jgi:PhzF family phenazine biosynthesis protein
VDIPFRIVDVFTSRPLAGNQLCVVPEPVDGLDDELMQSIAREIGFSETTFVSEASGDRYAMRIFTPGAEMPFAGHPTLGTAFLLVSEGRITSPATQLVAAGEFQVEVSIQGGTARVRQLPPTFRGELHDRAALAGAVALREEDLHADLPAEVVTTGLAHLILPVRDVDAVIRAAPDPDRVAAVLEESEATGFYVFAIEGDGRAKARMFASDVGVIEDPATGSAAGPLGAYLARHREGGMPGRLVIRQGEEIGRPSELFVDVSEDLEVWVEGGVRIVGRGAFEL